MASPARSRPGPPSAAPPRLRRGQHSAERRGVFFLFIFFYIKRRFFCSQPLGRGVLGLLRLGSRSLGCWSKDKGRNKREINGYKAGLRGVDGAWVSSAIIAALWHQ